jgi:hypothetical protein
MKLDEGPDLTSPTWVELIENGVHPTNDPVQTSIDAGLYFASRMSISSEVAGEVIDQFKGYTEYFKHDEWHPLAVEEVGNVVLYEDDNLKIVYNFKIDLYAEKGKIQAPFDHKTGSRRHEPSSLSNQFIGYCFAMKCDNIIVNKIGFQKTLKPAEKYQRYILTISKERIREWISNSIYWTRQFMQFKEAGFFPMNLTSCDKYAGCIFQKICESDPEARAWKLERDFHTVEMWDVARQIEKGEVK